MRNPFACLAKRDTARPSLRERAASLKASAARVIRRKPVEAASVSVLIVDPIFAAIDRTRRLTWARTDAANLPQPAGTKHVLPEQDAATDAFFAHVDDVLLNTVPTTAAGCTALARYALEFLENEGFCLDESASNDQHVRILDLIARSPMLGGEPTGRPLVPDFSGMSSNALIRTYEAFRYAFDINSLTTWALCEEDGSNRILDAEQDRLSHLQNDIADELARRAAYDGSASAGRRFETLIHRAVACGDYEQAARLASEADAAHC